MEEAPIKMPLRNQKTICGAMAKSTGKPCRRAPFKINGRCWVHGGKTPRGIVKQGLSLKCRGNTYATKTGEESKVFFNAYLSQEEKDLLDCLDDVPFIEQLHDEIKLTTLRERRMLERIEKLKREEYFTSTIVEEKTSRGVKKTTTREDSLIRIQEIEEALTRIQEKKMKLLELKNKYELQTGAENADLSILLAALGGAAEEVWEDGGPTE